MKDVKIEVVEKIAKSGNAYKALQITVLNVKIGDELIDEVALQPLFLNNLELIALNSKLK